MNFSTKILVLFGIIALSSCKKDDVVISQPPFISVINASPTLAIFDMYLNGAKINSGALSFGGVINYLQLTAAGEYTAKFTTDGGSESLLTKTVMLAQDSVYSFFLIGKSPDIDAVLIPDHVDGLQPEKAHIRFINLCPDASALSLAPAAETDITTNISYKQASSFIAVDAKDYVLDIKDSNTGVVKTTLTSLTLAAGRYYTIISRGMLTPADGDQSFSGQVIINY